MKKMLAMLLALSMMLSLAACAGGNDAQTTAAADGTTAAQEETQGATEAATQGAEETTAAGETVEVLCSGGYFAAEPGTLVEVQAAVQSKQAWWEGQATVYAQDEDGGYFFYNLACSEDDYALLTPGTWIRVTGYKSEWSGEVEIMDGTFEIIEGESFIAEPTDVTELLGTDELISHQNELVSFTGMTVEAADDSGAAFLYNWDGSGTEGDDLYFNASYNGETYTFTIESYLCDSSSEVYSAVKNLEVGQTIDMEGFLYWYEGVNPHITSVTVVE